jgi:2'-5' RNA ligase
MKRIFIALKVEAGKTLKTMISSLKSGLVNEGIRWTDQDNIHVTLVFLGDTDEMMITVISSMLKDKSEGSGNFELILRGAGVFKNINDPHVLWTGIDPSEKLTQLHSIIINGLRDTGTKIEERIFKPHLTLGRIKHLNDKTVLKPLLDKFQNIEIQKVPVNEVILYESRLLQSGPVYMPIDKFKL